MLFSRAATSFCFCFASRRGRARDQPFRQQNCSKKCSESDSRLNSVASLARRTCSFSEERIERAGVCHRYHDVRRRNKVNWFGPCCCEKVNPLDTLIKSVTSLSGKLKLVAFSKRGRGDAGRLVSQVAGKEKFLYEKSVEMMLFATC